MATVTQKEVGFKFRQPEKNGNTCSGCQHFTTANKVKSKKPLLQIPGRKKRRNIPLCNLLGVEVSALSVCNVWNDRSIENNWHFMVMLRKETASLVVKEDGKTLVNETVKFPIPSAYGWIKEQFKIAFKQFGAPDFVINMDPRSLKAEGIQDWFESMLIQYRELEVKKMKEAPRIWHAGVWLIDDLYSISIIDGFRVTGTRVLGIHEPTVTIYSNLKRYIDQTIKSLGKPDILNLASDYISEKQHMTLQGTISAKGIVPGDHELSNAEMLIRHHQKGQPLTPLQELSLMIDHYLDMPEGAVDQGGSVEAPDRVINFDQFCGILRGQQKFWFFGVNKEGNLNTLGVFDKKKGLLVAPNTGLGLNLSTRNHFEGLFDKRGIPEIVVNCTPDTFGDELGLFAQLMDKYGVDYKVLDQPMDLEEVKQEAGIKAA